MDRDRFDSLSKAVAAGASRRQLLKLLAGGALGGIAGVARIGSGDAKPRPDGCTGSGGNCDASRPCCADSVCINGKCCLTRKICDGARCTDLDNDPNNCGSCGNACAVGQICLAGVCGCTPDSCPEPFPNATVECRPGGCFFQCNPGFEDCDGNYENGCETVVPPPSDQSCGFDNCNRVQCPEETTCIRCGSLGAGICCPSGTHCGIGPDGQCGACVPDSDPVGCRRDITTSGRFIR